MRLTVIYDDYFISVDNVGMHFPDNWPFDETHIHAIQWYDDHGELEYRTADPNKQLEDQLEVQKYIDFHTVEYNKWKDEQDRLAEEERKRLVTWDEAMKELELQLNTMQKNHEQLITQMKTDHDIQIERIQENHMNLYNAANALQGNIGEDQYQMYENIVDATDNLTMFDGNVDPSLFDDSVDPALFETDGEPQAQTEAPGTTNVLEDFSNFDLSLLEDEFSLELLFEEEDPVVNEIEQLIKQDEIDQQSTPE